MRYKPDLIILDSYNNYYSPGKRSNTIIKYIDSKEIRDVDIAKYNMIDFYSDKKVVNIAHLLKYYLCILHKLHPWRGVITTRLVQGCRFMPLDFNGANRHLIKGTQRGMPCIKDRCYRYYNDPNGISAHKKLITFFIPSIVQWMLDGLPLQMANAIRHTAIILNMEIVVQLYTFAIYADIRMILLHQ